MSCPFGETGVGKMGEMPPNPPQELRRKAPATRPRIVSGNRPRGFTAQSVSEQEVALALAPPEARGVHRELALPGATPQGGRPPSARGPGSGAFAGTSLGRGRQPYRVQNRL